MWSLSRLSAGNSPGGILVIFPFRTTFTYPACLPPVHPPPRNDGYHGETQFFQICLETGKIMCFFLCFREKQGYFCKNGGVKLFSSTVYFTLKNISFFSFFHFFENFFEFFQTRFRRTVALDFFRKNSKKMFLKRVVMAPHMHKNREHSLFKIGFFKNVFSPSLPIENLSKNCLFFLKILIVTAQ